MSDAASGGKKSIWIGWFDPRVILSAISILIGVVGGIYGITREPSKQLSLVHSEGRFKLPPDAQGTSLTEAVCVDELQAINYGTVELKTIRITTPDAIFAEVDRSSGKKWFSTPLEIRLDELQPQEFVTIYIWSKSPQAKYRASHSEGKGKIIRNFPEPKVPMSGTELFFSCSGQLFVLVMALLGMRYAYVSTIAWMNKLEAKLQSSINETKESTRQLEEIRKRLDESREQLKLSLESQNRP